MTEEKIKKMLSGYRAAQGRLRQMEFDVAELKAHLEAARKQAAEEAAMPKAQNLDGMPHGSTPGDPTGRIGTALADGKIHDPEVSALEKKLADAEEAMALTRNDIAHMDNWLYCLLERELMVVNRKLIRGDSWPEVARCYAKRFGDDMSERSLMRMLDSAIYQISLIAED